MPKFGPHRVQTAYLADYIVLILQDIGSVIDDLTRGSS